MQGKQFRAQGVEREAESDKREAEWEMERDRGVVEPSC